ncbi:MAG: methyltransferase [Candidatus Hodarchaeales archaeon]|jgi:HemK-like putative methylase
MRNSEKFVTIGDFILKINPNVYVPGEDTFFLEDFIRTEVKCSYKSMHTCFDMGCGSGYLSLVLKSLFPDCTLIASDINPKATEITKFNLKNNKMDKNTFIFCSDLFDDFNPQKYNIQDLKFDLILFNPPYIPGNSPSNDNIQLENALLGGNPKGDKILMKFLTFLAKKKEEFFTEKGKLIILASSWNLDAINWIKTENH